VKEARIECLCPEYHITDMGIRFRRGESVWVSEEAARSSEELLLAVRSGAVSVVYARRCSVSRSPSPPNVRLNRAQRSGFIARTLSSEPQPTPERPDQAPPQANVDAGAIEAAIARGVTKAIEGLILSGALVPGGRGSSPTVVIGTAAPVVSSDAPVYIPSNIVPTGDATTITVAQTSSGGADLDEAAAALKATRKRKSTT